MQGPNAPAFTVHARSWEDSQRVSELLDDGLVLTMRAPYAHGLDGVYREAVTQEAKAAAARHNEAHGTGSAAPSKFQVISTSISDFETKNLSSQWLTGEGLLKVLPAADAVIPEVDVPISVRSVLGVDAGPLAKDASGSAFLPALAFVTSDTFEPKTTVHVSQGLIEQPPSILASAVRLALPLLGILLDSSRYIPTLPGTATILLAVGAKEETGFYRLTQAGKDVSLSRIFSGIRCHAQMSFSDFVHMALIRKWAIDDLNQRLASPIDRHRVRAYDSHSGPSTDFDQSLFASEASFRNVIQWPTPGDNYSILRNALDDIPGRDSEQLITIGLAQGRDPHADPQDRKEGRIVGMIHMIGNAGCPADLREEEWQKVIDIGQLDAPARGVHYLSYPDSFLVVLGNVTP